MRRILCPQLPKANRPTVLPETEATHAVRVLRLKDGDTVEAIDGQGHSVPAILRTHHGPPRLEVAGTASAAWVPPRSEAEGAVVPLVLEMAVLKGDAMEWVIEKAVELGARRLVPTLTAHTVVQVKTKGPEAFRERWQKIADQALKQCGRLERMEVELPIRLDELIAKNPASEQVIRFWCDEAAPDTTPDLIGALRLREPLQLDGSTQIRLLIGPEGGWSESERGLLAPAAEVITLGPLVLRAETAAIYGTSLIAAAFRASNRLTRTRG